MKDVDCQKPVANRFMSVVSNRDLQLIYSDTSIAQKYNVITQLGPLRPIFTSFIENEQKLNPLTNQELITLFDACSDERKSAEELLDILHKLSPGNGRVGFKQVNFLVDYLRNQIFQFLQTRNLNLELVPHEHAFGSGGDFWKTGHATTNASIVAAPLLRICKTGTSNVTAQHGSYQVTQEIGYDKCEFNPERLNNHLTNYGFAFVPLSSLGFPYSNTLTRARKSLWYEALSLLKAEYRLSKKSWQDVLKNTDIPLDVFKIVSPNAQVLNPVNHSTGVCHLKMIPYVLAIYLHLGSTGLIAHCYDGIDEVSNASSLLTKNLPNNLIVKVEKKQVTITEFSPEDLGFMRRNLLEIQEEKSLKNDADTFWKILSGTERGSKRDFVVLNVAFLLVAGNLFSKTEGNLINQLRDAVRIAEDLLDSGKSYKNFKQLLSS